MASVHDVAAYILQHAGSMTAMKLQKLAYYSQAWHLVWESRPLFDETIQAWANGPVTPALYYSHRRKFVLEDGDLYGDSSRLTQDEAESIDAVLAHYGHMTAYQLSDLTHAEAPWRDARVGLEPGARGDAEITPAAMAEFYEALVGSV